MPSRTIVLIGNDYRGVSSHDDEPPAVFGLIFSLLKKINNHFLAIFGILEGTVVLTFDLGYDL